MTLDDEINQAIVREMAKDKKPYTLRMRIKDLWYTHDKRLNDPIWLIDTSQFWKPIVIARAIGCSEQLVEKKLKVAMPMPHNLFNVYSGLFHNSKWFIYPLITKPLRKIQQGIDSVYDKIQSRNGLLFKSIIADLERLDDDQGDGEGSFIMHHVLQLGMTRKQMMILIMKFVVCIYEFDDHYEERADYILGRILEAKDSIYLDEQANPKNWHPHRDRITAAKHKVMRNTKP